MPAITSNHVNYLVWRYLQEEGLALSGYTLDKEAHASQWASEFKDQTGDGELVKLVLKGLQMLEIEKVRVPPELLATAQAKPINLEPLTETKLEGGHTIALPFNARNTSASKPVQVLIVGGSSGTAAYTLPELTSFANEAFAAAESPTYIEPEAVSDTIFIGYDNGTVRQWTLQNNSAELLSVFMLSDPDNAPIISLKRAPSGQLLASIDVRNVVALWDITTRTLVAQIDLGGLDAGLLTDAVWITDTMLAALQRDSIAVYTVGENTPRKLFHVAGASQLAFDSISRLLVSGADDGQVCLWSSHSDEPYGVMREHQGPITYVGWLTDVPISQPQLLTASTDGWLKLWALGNPTAVATADAGDPIYAVQTSDEFIAVLTKRGLKVYTKALKCIAEYAQDGVQSIVLQGRTLGVAAKNESTVYKITPA